MPALEAAFHAGWLVPDAARNPASDLDEADLCFGWSSGGGATLQIGIERFAGSEFRRATGRMEDLDLVLILPEPSRTLTLIRQVNICRKKRLSTANPRLLCGLQF